MPENHYRTGQAAKKWGISSHQVRRLCEAGLIAAEFSGKQWMIPESEVNRVAREGVPPVPQALDSDRQRVPDAGKGNGNHGLLAPPSEDVVEAAEDVAIAENRLKRRKLDRELEETEDWFRERNEREAQRIAEQEAAERERRERATTERERREWTDQWLDYAFRSIPHDAPREVRLDVREQVEAVLAKLPVPPRQQARQPQTNVELVLSLIDRVTDHLPPGGSRVKQLVDGAVEKALAPWRRRQEIETAIREAADSLPFHAKGYSWNPSEWEIRAKQDAADAIDKLRDGASPEEMKAAARHAVQPIIKQFEHERACKEVLSWAPLKLHGEIADDREQATTAAKAALDALPVGASQREREKARDAALVPIQAAIDTRHEQERAEAARRQDQETRQDVLRSAKIRLPWGMSREDTEEALTEIREALDELPEGTPRAKLDAAADGIIEEYKADHQREQKKQRLIEDGLRGIYAYIGKLLEKWDFDGKSAWTLEQEITPAIREGLEAALEGDEDAEELARLMRRLVREELGL